MAQSRIVVTGAAGEIGRTLRTGLAGRYALLRLSDRTPIDDLRPGESFVRAELSDLPALEAALEGMDAVVHLGGKAQEGTWEEVLQSNVIGTYNLFEAARRQGVRRVVFASSHHAVGFYPRGRTIDGDVPPRPDSRYGASKVFGEALGRLYADKHGFEVVCLRIGSFQDRPRNVRMLSTWISPADMVRLVQASLEAPDVRFEVVYGVSANSRSWWRDHAAERLGYRPQDDAEDYAGEILQSRKAADGPAPEPAAASMATADVLRAVTANRAEGPIEGRFQGGPLCGMEFSGDPDLA